MESGCSTPILIQADNAQLEWELATKWEGMIKDVIWNCQDKEARFRHKQWQQVFDEQLKSTPATIQMADPMFSLPLGEHTEKWTVWLPDKEAVMNRVYTISSLSNVKGEEADVSCHVSARK